MPQGFFGVMYDNGIEKAADEVQDAQWDLMASSGVETVRTVFDWGEAQPGGRGTAFDFERTDGVVRRAALRNIDVLPIVFYAPRWARAYRNRFTSPPKNRSDYVTYLAALVERYGPDGTFWTEHPELPKRPLREWQIWNEPHLPAYWDAPEQGPYGYARAYPLLLRASYNIVKSLDPGAKIVMAGLTQRAWEEIEVLYQNGIKRYFDVAALQIFPQTVKRAVKATTFFRDAMRARGDGRKPIYLTEITWPASKGRTRGDQVPAPGDAARDGHEAERGLQGDGVRRRRARRGQGVLVHVVVALRARRQHLQLRRAPAVRRPAASSRSRRWAPTSGAARRYQGCAKTVTGVCE